MRATCFHRHNRGSQRRNLNQNHNDHTAIRAVFSCPSRLTRRKTVADAGRDPRTKNVIEEDPNMKRDWLKSLGIGAKDTLDKIMAENGKDIRYSPVARSYRQKSVHPVFSAYQCCFPQYVNPSDS